MEKTKSFFHFTVQFFSVHHAMNVETVILKPHFMAYNMKKQNVELIVREEYISFSNTDLVSAKMTRSSAKRKQLIFS